MVSSKKSSNFAPAFEKQACFPFPPTRCIKLGVSFEVLFFLPLSQENPLKDLFLSNAENQPITKKNEKKLLKNLVIPKICSNFALDFALNSNEPTKLRRNKSYVL